jgi:UDP-N-acetyl-2-amino-2-deoxyglucuronate dehydrogenase
VGDVWSANAIKPNLFLLQTPYPMKTFALIGAAGYIAPRHMAAIKAVGGSLVAAMDKHDSVGILDSYFPECDFFTEYEIFERYLYKNPVDYLVVCTPNYLHYAHIALGLQSGCNVICEKPVVLTEGDIDSIMEIEAATGKKCYTILQLREHEAIKCIKGINHNKVKINYYTPRGRWYHHSWKGDYNRSGGLLMNIGVHFFDLMLWKFGSLIEHNHFFIDKEFAGGDFNTQHAYVTWDLGTKVDKPMRALIINDERIDLSPSFTDLHTKVYESILAGRGVRIEETRVVIRLINEMR